MPFGKNKPPTVQGGDGEGTRASFDRLPLLFLHIPKVMQSTNPPLIPALSLPLTTFSLTRSCPAMANILMYGPRPPAPAFGPELSAHAAHQRSFSTMAGGTLTRTRWSRGSPKVALSFATHATCGLMYAAWQSPRLTLCFLFQAPALRAA